MERQLMEKMVAVVDHFMRQDKATRRRVLELLEQHLTRFQSDLDRLLREEKKGRKAMAIDLAQENIREQFLLHELFNPPVVDRDPEEDDDLI